MSKETKKSDTHEERYIHLTVEGPRIKNMTLFARKEDDGTWYAAVSFCHKDDHFERRIGRQVARRRYFNKDRAILGKEFTYEVALGAAQAALAEIG